MRSSKTLALFLSILTLSTPSLSWGSLGHRTVAYLSTFYINSTLTTPFINSLLLGQDISEAALFPDKVAHLPQFAYSRPWHYIDAKDDPPHQCGLNMSRDCALNSGCVVTAIANHTERVTNASLPRFLRAQSLRYTLHFHGDIHQPLHTESSLRGGNEIPVLFDGKHTNLHSVWDTLVPNKARHRNEWDPPMHKNPDERRESEEEAAYLWAQELWGTDSDSSREVGEGECVGDAATCALEWANEANAYVCSYVLRDDVEGVQGMDLGGEYFEGAREIVDVQIRRAGRRLGVWLDLLAGKWAEELERMRIRGGGLEGALDVDGEEGLDVKVEEGLIVQEL